MTVPAPCPRCRTGTLARHGYREVDVAVVEGGRLAWGRTSIDRMMCRSCGKTSGGRTAEAEASMREARAFVFDVYVGEGMEAAMEASGLTDRTVERWVEALSDDSLAGELPVAILLSVTGGHVLVSDAADGTALDAAAGEVDGIADLLVRRAGDVDVAWIWPSMRIKEGVERAFPEAALRMPGQVSRQRLDALLSELDVQGGPPEARYLSEIVASSGWDRPALGALQALWRPRGGTRDAFLTLWRDEIVAGLESPDPATPTQTWGAASLIRLRALISSAGPVASASA